MPALDLLLAFDTRWRAYRAIHRRSEDVDELHELFRELAAEISRLGLVERLTGRFGFEGDAKAALAECLELARQAGVTWPEVVEVVNKMGEAGR